MSVNSVTNEQSSSDNLLQVLLQRARAGSNSALGELLQSYRDYLTLIADDEIDSDLKVKASTSDLVQDSCLEAQRDFAAFAGTTPDEFRHWLRQVLLNNVANVVRSFRGTAKRDIQKETLFNKSDISSESTLTPSGVAVQNEQLEALRNALGILPVHYQEVISLRNYERLSFEEIGERLERSSDAVRKLWVRAVESLQQEMDRLNESSAGHR